MNKKIILSAEEAITCPHCRSGFSLEDGITRQTIERYESEYAQTFDAHKKELEGALAQEAERKAVRQTADQVRQLQEKLQEAVLAEQRSRELVAKAQADARNKAVAEFELERKALDEDIARKEEKLQQFREQEIALRRQKQQLEEAQQNLQLDMQRKLDEERARLSEQIAHKEAERFQLIEAEYKKKIEDAQRANDDLRRKLDQGSQQLQGEVLELELEQCLASSFLHDEIAEVKKGQRGADVIQTVRTPSGQVCGRIVWEAKRAEHWSDKWLQKLKDDQQEAKADLAVLVTTALPKGENSTFARHGDVWVVAPHLMKPLAETLRVILLESHKLKLVNTGRAEKMELLYNYLASPQFAQRVRTVLESFAQMKGDLDAEKRAMQRIWAKREVQIERVTASMTGVVGELQAIAHDALPQLDVIDALALPE